MSLLKLDGVELYYELHGDGPPVIFIHGASGTHLTWWQQIAEMRYHFSCLIYDLRGFGRSRPTGPYNVGDGHPHYEDLRELINHVGFGAEKLSIVGASLGTGPAMHFAMENRDRMNKLVLVCGPGGASSPLIAAGWERRYARFKSRGQQLQNSAQPAARSNRVPPVRSPGEMERFAVAYHPYGPVGETMHLDFPALTFLYAEIMAMTGAAPTIDLLPCFHARPVTADEAGKIEFPVLVIGGSEDALFPPADLEEVAALFPQGRSYIFKGAGHAAYYEKARRFNDLLLRFLQHGHAD